MEQKHFESLYPENSWDNEIEKLVSYIKEGNSSQLVGIPGSGRSNVLGLLAYNATVRLRHFPKHHDSVHFVMVNFSEVKKRSYTDVVKFIFLSLDTSLRERGMQEEYEKVDGLFKDGLNFNDELVLSQRLKDAIDYLAAEKKLTIIFLFDRFDEYIPQVSDDLFILLRSLRDRAKYRFSVIFSLSRPLEDSLEPELLAQFSDFVVGHIVYMPLYDEPSVSFRIGYLQKLTGKVLSDGDRKELLELTGGHIRLVKASSEALLSKTDQNSMEHFLLEQKTVQTALLSIWKGLSPSEQQALESPPQIEENSFLEKIGLIKDGKEGISLLRLALKKGLIKDREVKLSYDEATNSIKKGEIVLSDTLTKAEFRLLRYLLEHSDEIVDRDTIVSTVWREDKSADGITDQAIDQLIFRLRRKIEADPNNPTHLQTIKGRGIRYSPSAS